MAGEVRHHGAAPYRTTVLHGGPGAVGSARELAAGLGCALEPLQSACTVEGQIAELAEQLAPYPPLAVIGHSWGAWLGAMYAARFPERVTRLILVGCGALDEAFVPRMVERRLAHFTPEQRVEYRETVRRLEEPEVSGKNALLGRLGELCEAADCYAVLPEASEGGPDGNQYAGVWPEAARMRRSGELIECFREVKAPLAVIHGDYDTTPVAAITEPLQAHSIPFKLHLLKRCGHTPWRERYAKDEFFEILRKLD